MNIYRLKVDNLSIYRRIIHAKVCCGVVAHIAVEGTVPDLNIVRAPIIACSVANSRKGVEVSVHGRRTSLICADCCITNANVSDDPVRRDNSVYMVWLNIDAILRRSSKSILYGAVLNVDIIAVYQRNIASAVSMDVAARDPHIIAGPSESFMEPI